MCIDLYEHLSSFKQPVSDLSITLVFQIALSCRIMICIIVKLAPEFAGIYTFTKEVAIVEFHYFVS